jgi:hypothetical protein
MGHPDGTVYLINMLSTRPGGPHALETEVLIAQFFFFWRHDLLHSDKPVLALMTGTKGTLGNPLDGSFPGADKSSTILPGK